MNDSREKRAFPRFKIEQKIKAMILTATDSKHVICRIDNISMGGIALSYANGTQKSFQPREISILYQENFWGISSLPVKLIWQREEDRNNGEGARRRIGLCFQEINYQKKSQLKHFIEHFSRQDN